MRGRGGIATGQRKTGEVDGGDIRAVWMLVGWTERLGPPSSIWVGWIAFPSFQLWSLLSLSTLCVTLTLFVLFASVFALLSALSLSLYSFFGVSIFPLRSLNSASYSAQFIAGPSPFSACIDSPSLPLLRCRALFLSLHPISDRRATAYCTYVISSKV